MSDVLLFNAPVRGAQTDQHASLGLPLGLAYIAAVAATARLSSLDRGSEHQRYGRRQVRALIEAADPAILGISTHTETYLGGLECARIAKELKPGLTVVMGGAHSSVMYDEVIREDSVDYVGQG